MTPHPIIQQDLIDNEGNLRAADIGITWEGSEAFLRGVRVVGPSATELPGRREAGCLETPDTPLHRIGQEGRQGYRPAAPIQHFNNKSLNWPSWFRHFKAAADIHGWDKSQRVLQLVSSG